MSIKKRKNFEPYSSVVDAVTKKERMAIAAYLEDIKRFIKNKDLKLIEAVYDVKGVEQIAVRLLQISEIYFEEIKKEALTPEQVFNIANNGCRKILKRQYLTLKKLLKQ